MLEVALPHWRTFPACLVSPIAASSGRRATLKRLSVQCDLQQLFIRFGRIIHAGTACSFTMPRAASRSATLNRFSRKSRRSSPGGSCGKAALFGIGSMPLLNPPGMLLRPDAEVLKKPTSICIPMPRSRSLEPVVLRFKQSPPQKHNAPSFRSRMLATLSSVAAAYPKPTCPSPAASGSETRVFADARCGSAGCRSGARPAS
jgi:hypothetical protein